MRVFAADPADAYISQPLDFLTAVYHRASGMTHVVIEPMPQILDCLIEKPMTEDQLMSELRARFDLDDTAENRTVLLARLDEMTEVGLVASS